jgi:TonB family protein
MTNTSRQFGYAIAIAAALHAVLFAVAGLFVFWGFLRSLDFTPSSADDSAADDSLTVVIEPEVAPPVPVPELVATEPAEPSKKAPAVKYIRTNSADPSEPPEPGTAAFISDRNTKGASEAEPNPNGDKNLPSMKGADSPLLDLANRNFAEGEHSMEERAPTGIQDQPSPLQPAAPPTPEQDLAKIVREAAQKRAEQQLAQTTAPLDPSTPNVDPTSDLATKAPEETPKEPPMQEPKFEKLFPEERKAQIAQEERPPTPRPSDASTGTAGAPKGRDLKAAQTQTLKNTVQGGITNRGKASVDAADTPMGRYMSKVNTAVSQKFTPACMKARDRVTYGTVQVEFDVNLSGGVENLRIASGGTGNAVLQDLVLGVVLQSKLPPVPAELQEYLIGNRLHITYGFLFH